MPKLKSFGLAILYIALGFIVLVLSYEAMDYWANFCFRIFPENGIYAFMSPILLLIVWFVARSIDKKPKEE
jgi:hypothetical protein